MEADDDNPLENMSPEQEASFLQGLKDADEGRTTPNEEVKKEYQKWLSK